MRLHQLFHRVQWQKLLAWEHVFKAPLSKRCFKAKSSQAKSFCRWTGWKNWWIQKLLKSISDKELRREAKMKSKPCRRYKGRNRSYWTSGKCKRRKWWEEFLLGLSDKEPDWYPGGFDPWPCAVGQGSGTAVNCGAGCRHCLDLTLRWLWHWLAAAAPIRPLTWELPYAANEALKKQNQKQKEKKKWLESNTWLFPSLFDIAKDASTGFHLYVRATQKFSHILLG